VPTPGPALSNHVERRLRRARGRGKAQGMDQAATLQPVVLQGRHIRLEPLSLAHHPGLAVVGTDEQIWHWNPFQALRTPDDVRHYIIKALAAQAEGRALPFATVLLASGEAIGSTRFLDFDPVHRRLEIGSTWIAPAWQRTAVNTEAKYLMLRHAFDTLGCIRVEFKTDALNERSRRALARIGATEEGTFRNHMLTHTGRIRDSVFFSILDREWPDVRARLEARLTSS
jgi:N-acetyltransferase